MNTTWSSRSINPELVKGLVDLASVIGTAFGQPEGRIGPMTSPRWSCGGASLMPRMSAFVCTAMWRKEAAGCTTMPARSAIALKPGSANRYSTRAMESAPSMLPPEWERIFFSAKGLPQSSSAIMLQR